jgi:PX domain
VANSEETSLMKRFSEFEQLSDELQDLGLAKLPKIPGIIFIASLSNLEKRRQGLQLYLQ